MAITGEKNDCLEFEQGDNTTNITCPACGRWKEDLYFECEGKKIKLSNFGYCFSCNIVFNRKYEALLVKESRGRAKELIEKLGLSCYDRKTIELTANLKTIKAVEEQVKKRREDLERTIKLR